MNKRVEFDVLQGKTLVAVDKIKSGYDDWIIFKTSDGKSYIMQHHQDCCESVYIEDVCGDLQALVGNPLGLAEEYTEDDEGDPDTRYTFYKLSTVKEDVTIRWCGSSEYYSVSVDFEEIV